MISKIGYKIKINLLNIFLKVNREKLLNEKKVIYLDTPEHANLGDQMIARAGEELIKSFYPNLTYLEYSDVEYEIVKKELGKIISKEDIIILHGGGNFGNLYFHHEERRREIVKKFHENKIIFMPQTITYLGSEASKELKKTVEIYEAHKNLTIICRENESYEFAKQNFTTNKVILAPDTVNFLEGEFVFEDKEKSEALFLLRKDKEKIRDEKIIINIKEYLRTCKVKLKMSDTHLGDIRIVKSERNKITDKLINEIKSSKLVVTDRLHGMILSIITNVPVIALNSLDGKVKKSYDTWFKNYKNVFFLERSSELEDLVDRVLSVQTENTQVTKNKLKEIFSERVK